MAGADAIGWSSTPAATRQGRIVACVTTIFGSAVPAELVAVHEFDWATQEWVGGCPVASPAPGLMMLAGHTLRQAHQRVVFAGTETATVWPGFLNGAVQVLHRSRTVNS